LLLPACNPDLPHVLVEDRLIEWTIGTGNAQDAQGHLVGLNPMTLGRAKEATFLSYKDSTCATYSTGIANYVKFLIQHKIAKDSWLPMSMSIVWAWIAAHVGSIGQLAISKAIAGVH
jgi:hypothetical protein